MQHATSQIQNHKSGTSGKRGETVTFADIAGVDEAKEELEEIVVRHSFIIFSAYNLPSVLTFKGFLSYSLVICFHFESSVGTGN